MSDAYRKAAIYVRNEYAGVIKETEDGYSFMYDRAYLDNPNAVSASITLPLTDSKYESAVLFPFFDGLIPEGWLLDIASRNWKLDRNDRFGLLLACCRDCIGDLSVREVSNEM